MPKSKKIIAFLALMFMFITVFSPIYAQAEELSVFDRTYVMDDLNSSTIGDKPFDEKDYPLNGNADLQIIQLVEYSYSEFTEINKYYGLYLYLYNPKNMNFIKEGNTVSMSTAFNIDTGAPVAYENIPITFLSKSGSDNRFYKFKIADSQRFLSIVNSTTRTYDIAGVQLKKLNKDMVPEIIDYKIGTTCTFTGYAAGCGGPDEPSTLQCKVTNLETIEITDLTPITYRSETSSLGRGYQNQVDSVMFSIPKRFQREYGQLQRISAEWYEFRTEPILVIEKEDIYNAFKKQVTNILLPDPSYAAFSNYYAVSGAPSSCDWKYNDIYNGAQVSERTSDFLWNVFWTKGQSASDFILKSEDLIKHIRGFENPKTHKIDINGRKVAWGPISAPLTGKNFDGKDKIGGGKPTIVNVDAGNKFDLLGLSEKYDGDDKKAKLMEYGLFYWLIKDLPDVNDSSYEIMPIQQLVPGWYEGDEITSKKYLIPQKSISTYMNKPADNDIAGKDTFIFHFAQSDYYREKFQYCKNEFFTLIYEGGYMAQENIYLDFDILSLTFNADGKYTVIPVVANPIDVVGAITPPPNMDFNLLDLLNKLGKKAGEALKWIVIIVLTILAIAIVILLAPFIVKVIKAIWRGLCAVGRGIKAVFVKTKDGFVKVKNKVRRK